MRLSLWAVGLFSLLLVTLQLFPASFATTDAYAAKQTAFHWQKTSFTLDDVTVNVTTPFLPGRFTTSAPGGAIQMATAITPGLNVHPFGGIYITAVPFGTRPKTEGNVPLAQPGGARSYLSSMYAYRLKEGDTPQRGPAASLFGQTVTGVASLIHGNAKIAYASTIVVEWVVEAGKRLWVVRIANQAPLGTTSLASGGSFLAALSYFTLTSSTLAHATTINKAQAAGPATGGVLSSYPIAPWWSSACTNNPDYVNVDSPTGAEAQPPETSDLGNWRGLDSCYTPDTVVDWDVTFNVTSHGINYSGSVAEWECVELSMRYLLESNFTTSTWSLPNASAVNLVNSYPGQGMNRYIGDGTSQMLYSARTFHVGDVLSWADMSSVNVPDWNAAGHTAIVIAITQPDSTGNNGSFTVLQENSHSYWTETFTITDGKLEDSIWSAGDQRIVGWLDPASSTTTTGR
jgi:hypothetical protein